MEEYWPDLSRSGLIYRDPARLRPPVANLKPPDKHLKPTRPNPADPKLYTGRLRVPISPTIVYRVESRLGINPTQADPWTPLMVILFYPRLSKISQTSYHRQVGWTRKLLGPKIW